MKLGGCLFGGIITTILRAVFTALQFIAAIIGKTIYYFGLYIPIFYLIYGMVIHFVYDFECFELTVDGKLYIFGLCLSLLASLIISIKNLIVKPYRKYIKKDDVVEYGKTQRLSKNAPEAPRIYKSKVNPGVIVYEYANRYDLYEEDNKGLVQVATEYKKSRKNK